MLGQLQRQARTKGLAGKVDFLGAMTMAQIEEATADASFFLQLSRQEGMAMSVVESMQLGLVPVVTKVGEIANYCRDGENAVMHRTIDDTVRQIETLLGDDDEYRRMSSAAAEHWADVLLYQEDILRAARAMSSADMQVCSKVAV
jgi:glycosyltransferase involved in cell wall biosynthesis